VYSFSFQPIAIKPRLVFVALCAILITAGLCPAVTYTVDDDGPADFSTIQAAINAAADSDTIIVSQGRYYENIDFRGKAVTVTSTAPADTQVRESTIIDANNNGIVVSFHTNEGLASIITGLTITAGHAKYGAGICCWDNCSPTISHCVITENHSSDISNSQGAGIYCQENSNPNLSNCIFTGNSANYYGGGMYNSSSDPTVTNCTFSGNSAYSGGGMYNNFSSPTVTNCTFSGNSAVYGGGMCNFGSNPTVADCTFSGNSAGNSGGGMLNNYSNPTVTNCKFSSNSASSDGGGMCNCGSDPTVTDCTFSGNSATYYDGGGMYNSGSNPTVTNCTFSGNSANTYGGGMCNSGSPTITNCTFSGNSTNSSGGGICCEINCNPVIRNCTITGNRAVTGAGGIDLGENCDAVITNNIICDSPSGSGIYALYCDPAISYNNVYGNADGDYDGWAWPGVGDISVDPLFRVHPRTRRS